MFAPLLIASLGLQGHRPIEDRFVWAAPLPGLPSVRIDGLTTGRTLATQWAKNFLVQGRLIWIDGTANLDRVNSKAKISALAAHIADAGFNTIVFDVKPISGQTLYPSKIAPQIQEWRGKTMPTGFDPLAAMTREAHRRHLSLFVSLNAFSEGHSLFRVGPGYAHPEWQTVLYEPVPILRAVDDAEYPLADPLDYPAEGQDSLAVLRSPAGPCEFAVTLNAGHYVVDGFELGGRGRGVPTVPRGGLVVQGSGRAAAFLREHAWPGTRMRLMTRPAFVPISHRPEEQFPLLLNPNDPAVQAYELSIVREVASRYAIDGMLFDDRFRYAGLRADFSQSTRALFERRVGKKLRWPDDVYQATVTPSLGHGMEPGPYYQAWIDWRATRLRDYLRRARAEALRARPRLQFGMYVGAWYGEYPALGVNYAASDFDAGFWFMSDDYRRAGVGDLVDFLIPGCYYTTPTIAAALVGASPIGATVESAATLASRTVRDRAWVYAGINLLPFRGDQAAISDCLQAACSSSQGVMVFDLSHETEALWPLFKRAFAQRMPAPHQKRWLIRRLRNARRSLDRRGVREPPVVIAAGNAGTGQ